MCAVYICIVYIYTHTYTHNTNNVLTKVLKLVSGGVARARALLALGGIWHAHESLGASSLVLLWLGRKRAVVAGVALGALRRADGLGDLLGLCACVCV
jgi:hypothetical protein